MAIVTDRVEETLDDRTNILPPQGPRVRRFPQARVTTGDGSSLSPPRQGKGYSEWVRLSRVYASRRRYG
jgi:hypothetical protein